MEDDWFSLLVLPMFRAATAAWAAGASTFNADAAHVAANAASDVAAVIAGDIVDASDASSDAASSAFAAVDDPIGAVAFAAAAATAAAATAFWSAVSIDATRVEDCWSVSEITGSQLWPQGQPELFQSLWLEMKTMLLAARQDWLVWIHWYDLRLAGRIREEVLELAYTQIDDDLWNQGPAIVNAEIKRRIEELERVAPVPPEPSPELGPVLQVTERGLEIISQPSEGDFEEQLQKALYDRLRRLLPELTDATHRVANAHPALDHIISEYSDLIARPFDQLDVASLWAVGTGLLAFRAAFTNQPSGTMTEPLEPGHLAMLQQAAEMHGGFILGFPKGWELTERADRTRLSPEIIAQIAPPARRILEGLARANDFVESRTRKFFAAVDESLIVHGWGTARIGHAIYVTTRNSIIALGKYLILANIGCAAILGKPILPALDLDAHTSQLIVEFVMHHAQEVLSFAEPFPELRNWIGFVIDHIDREK